MITGYVFNDRRTDAREFLQRLVRGLIVPWLALTVPIALLKSIVKPNYGFISYIGQLLSGNLLWYMPCCILAEIIWFFILKVMHDKTNRMLKISVTAIVFFASGLLCADLGALDFAMLNRAMVVQLYLLMGYVFREYQEEFDKLGSSHLVFLLAAYVAMGCLSLHAWPSEIIDVHLGKYYSLPLCFLMIGVGCFALFTVASRHSDYPAIVCFIGQNTLVYYILHGMNIGHFDKVLSALGMKMVSPLLLASVETIFACIACGVEAAVLNRLLPEAVGKRRAPKNAVR